MATVSVQCQSRGCRPYEAKPSPAVAHANGVDFFFCLASPHSPTAYPMCNYVNMRATTTHTAATVPIPSSAALLTLALRCRYALQCTNAAGWPVPRCRLFRSDLKRTPLAPPPVSQLPFSSGRWCLLLGMNSAFHAQSIRHSSCERRRASALLPNCCGGFRVTGFRPSCDNGFTALIF